MRIKRTIKYIFIFICLFANVNNVFGLRRGIAGQMPRFNAKDFEVLLSLCPAVSNIGRIPTIKNLSQATDFFMKMFSEFYEKGFFGDPVDRDLKNLLEVGDYLEGCELYEEWRNAPELDDALYQATFIDGLQDSFEGVFENFSSILAVPAFFRGCDKANFYYNMKRGLDDIKRSSLFSINLGSAQILFRRPISVLIMDCDMYLYSILHTMNIFRPRLNWYEEYRGNVLSAWGNYGNLSLLSFLECPKSSPGGFSYFYYISIFKDKIKLFVDTSIQYLWDQEVKNIKKEVVDPLLKAKLFNFFLNAFEYLHMLSYNRSSGLGD